MTSRTVHYMALILLLGLPLGATAQSTRLKLFDATTTTGASRVIDNSDTAHQGWILAVYATGSPTGCSISLQDSDDNAVDDAYADVTATAGSSNPLTCSTNRVGRVVYFGNSRYLRANLATFSGGTAPTLTAWLIAIPTTQIGSFPGSNTLGGSPTANQVLASDGTDNDWRSFALGTAGADLSWAHAADTITLNVPSASLTARGVVTTGVQTFAGSKTFTATDASPAQSVGTAATTIANQFGYYGRVDTSAAAITLTTGAAYYAASPVKGAGSTMSNNYGVYIDAQGIAGSNSYGLNIIDVTGGSTNYAIKTGAGLVEFGSTAQATKFLTAVNCADGTATPADCTSAPAGGVIISAAATTVTVNTSAVTANSQIFVFEDSSLGTRLSVTCNTTLGRTYAVTARTAATSFVITASAAPVTNPACLNYWIVN